METVTDFIFLGSRITAGDDCSYEIRILTPWKKSYDQPRQYIKKQRHYFANKGLSSQSCGFSSSCGWMWELDYKESWGPKNWCFWTVMLEKTLGSPLCCSPLSHKELDMTEQLNWTDTLGFPRGASGKESACQCRRCKRRRFHHWVGKIPWSRKWLSTPVFLPGKFHGHKNLEGPQPTGPQRIKQDWAHLHSLHFHFISLNLGHIRKLFL